MTELLECLSGARRTQSLVSSLKWVWWHVLIMLVLESARQRHPWGLPTSQNSLLGKFPVRRRPCLKNKNKPTKVDRAKRATLESDIWPRHLHTHLRQIPHCPASIVISCYSPFPEITVLLNLIILLAVVSVFTTFVCSFNVCCFI